MKRIVMVASLALVASQARAQGAVEARLSRALDGQTYAAVNEVIAGARARSLPVDPIVDKALEGSVKKAPPALIRSAVSALAKRMEVARDALAPGPTEAEITAGAEALARDIPRETLRTIRLVSGSRSVAVPLGVLTELVVRGVSVSRASDQVVALVRSGATPQQLASLGEEVQRDMAAGIAANAALDIRSRGLLPLLPGAAGGASPAATLKPAPKP